LRERGIDALSFYDMHQQGCADATLLAYAASQNCILLTHNIRHFVTLHRQYLAEGRSHAGILVTNERYIGQLLDRLLALIQVVTAEEMMKTLRFL